MHRERTPCSIGIFSTRYVYGKSWSAKGGMVRRVEIGDEEVDVIDAEMLGGAELNRQRGS